MHPDYLDYARKSDVHVRAKWHDVKYLCRRLAGCELSQIYVGYVDYGSWLGWIVEFSVDVDLSEFKRNVSRVVVVGERAIFIGVING